MYDVIDYHFLSSNILELLYILTFNSPSDWTDNNGKRIGDFKETLKVTDIFVKQQVWKTNCNI
jgi:hypothetical protein